MPVDRAHSRLHQGKPDPLGPVGPWECPGCGVQNDVRRVEQGCEHCGAGVPGQVRPPSADPLLPPGEVPSVATPPAESGIEKATNGALGGSSGSAVVVYRIIRYATTNPAWLATTLQRSLVGEIDMGGSRITATIVDDVSPRQEDLLRLASRQPGVWLSNPIAMEPLRGAVSPPYAPSPLFTRRQQDTPMTDHRTTTEPLTILPPALAALVLAIAAAGHPTTYTIAMALDSFATALEGETMEPEKYLSPDDARALAVALLATIPEGWDPRSEMPATGEGDE